MDDFHNYVSLPGGNHEGNLQHPITTPRSRGVFSACSMIWVLVQWLFNVQWWWHSYDHSIRGQFVEVHLAYGALLQPPHPPTLGLQDNPRNSGCDPESREHTKTVTWFQFDQIWPDLGLWLPNLFESHENLHKTSHPGDSTIPITSDPFTFQQSYPSSIGGSSTWKVAWYKNETAPSGVISVPLLVEDTVVEYPILR